MASSSFSASLQAKRLSSSMQASRPFYRRGCPLVPCPQKPVAELVCPAEKNLKISGSCSRAVYILAVRYLYLYHGAKLRILSIPRVVVQNSETASRHHAPPPARSRIWFSCRSPLKRLYLPSRSRIYSCAEAYGCSYAPHERSGHHWLSTPLYHKLS